jgi:hypothetical protein
MHTLKLNDTLDNQPIAFDMLLDADLMDDDQGILTGMDVVHMLANITGSYKTAYALIRESGLTTIIRRNGTEVQYGKVA